jgi:transposase InsO family protein
LPVQGLAGSAVESGRDSGGRPGDRIGGLPVAPAAQPRGRPIHTPLLGVLRRPVESAQYTSWAFTQRAKDSGLLPSMGTIGDAYDNAVIESFWARMQTELLDRRQWKTRVELANAIFEYLEIFHNRQRRHSSLGWRTPIEYEKLHATDVA